MLALLILLVTWIPGLAAGAQEIPTERPDPEAEYPIGGISTPVEGLGFVAAWSRGGLRSFGVDEVFPSAPVAVRLSPTGAPIGPILALDEGDDRLGGPLAIASALPGEAVVVLNGFSQDDEPVTAARRIFADGTLGPLRTIDTCPGGSLEPRGSAGYYLVCDGRVERLTLDGRPFGETLVLLPADQVYGVRASVTADGGLWLVWAQEVDGTPRAMVRRFGSDGAPRTATNTFARLPDRFPGGAPIDVAALPGGGAAVIWVGREGVVSGRLMDFDARSTTAAPILLPREPEGSGDHPRVTVGQGLVAFAWRENVVGGTLADVGRLRLVPIATGAPLDEEVGIEDGYVNSLGFDARGRLGILAWEERPLDFQTYPSPRFGVAPLASLVPPPGDGVVPSELPGFRFWVRIGGNEPDPRIGTLEPLCQPETVCFSGALAGRSEVEVRIVGPKPNGYLWPNVVRFTTSQVEVWIEQLATGERRYYRLDAVERGSNELDGLYDRFGFLPQ